MSLNVTCDAKLVTAYIQGDEKAFEELVGRHKDKVFTTIYLIVKDKKIAEDILQDTFIKAIHTLKGGRYNEDGKFKPWLCRIAHNMAIDHFRKNQRNPTVTIEERSNIDNSLDFSEESIEKETITMDTKNKLHSLIEQLPESQRTVLIMRHFSGLSFKEISEETGVSINTALGRMRYALINLRKELERNNVLYDENFYPK